MILTDVQHYPAEHKQATIGDLALHFEIAPDAMRGMLDFLVKKGKVYPLPLRPKCKGCTLCDTTFLETYEWLET
ncbi:MAG TPA: FeoC-like transcriptional regulator [Candidatus Entotheonella sp.]